MDKMNTVEKQIKVSRILVGESAEAAELVTHDRRIDGNKTCLCGGIITIIGDEGVKPKVKKRYCTDKPITLNDCLKIIRYKGRGVVMVIFEEPLKGEIYEYGNYADKCWVKHGTTKGYA